MRTIQGSITGFIKWDTRRFDNGSFRVQSLSGVWGARCRNHLGVIYG